MLKEKVQRYSIRKLTVGAASVLVGLAFAGHATSTQASAATVDQTQVVAQNNTSTQAKGQAAVSPASAATMSSASAAQSQASVSSAATTPTSNATVATSQATQAVTSSATISNASSTAQVQTYSSASDNNSAESSASSVANETTAFNTNSYKVDSASFINADTLKTSLVQTNSAKNYEYILGDQSTGKVVYKTAAGKEVTQKDLTVNSDGSITLPKGYTLENSQQATTTIKDTSHDEDVSYPGQDGLVKHTWEYYMKDAGQWDSIGNGGYEPGQGPIRDNAPMPSDGSEEISIDASDEARYWNLVNQGTTEVLDHVDRHYVATDTVKGEKKQIDGDYLNSNIYRKDTYVGEIVPVAPSSVTEHVTEYTLVSSTPLEKDSSGNYVATVTPVTPQFKDITTIIGETPQADSVVTNKNDLPDGTKISWSQTPDTKTTGDKTGKVTVTYPDGSTKDGTIKVTVKKDNATITINYVDSDNNNSVVSSKVQTFKIGTVNDLKISNPDATKYDLVNSSDLNSYKNYVTPKDDGTITIKLKHKIIDESNDTAKSTKEITRTITGTKPDGTTINDTQKITVHRTVSKDAVTGKETFGDWSNGKFDSVKIPQIDGYTSSTSEILAVNVVNGNFTDPKISITYSANPQTAAISYIDDTTGNVLKKDSANGHFKEKIVFSSDVNSTVKDYESKGYTLVSNNFNNPTYQSNNLKNNYEVHFKHTTEQITADNPKYAALTNLNIKVNTLVITKNDDFVRDVVSSSENLKSTRSGELDKATNKISWGKWSDVAVSGVNLGDMTGYYLIDMESAEGLEGDDSSKDNGQLNFGKSLQEVDPSQSSKASIEYNPQDIKDSSKVRTLVVNRIFSKNPSWQTVKINLIDKDTNKTIETIEDKDGASNGNIYVQPGELQKFANLLKQSSSNTSADDYYPEAGLKPGVTVDTLKQAIKEFESSYDNVSNSGSTLDDEFTNLKNGYTKVKKASDKVLATGYNPYSLSMLSLLGYTSTELSKEGYAVVDNPIEKNTFVFDHTDNGNNSEGHADKEEQSINIYYSKIQNAKINFIDDTTGETLEVKTISGDAGTKSTYTDTNEIKTYESKGYGMVSDDTNSNPITFDKDSSVDQIFNVHLKHKTQPKVDSKVIAETIHYNYEDGTKAHDDYEAKHIVVSRTGYKDLVTGKTTFDGEWSSETFPEVTSPVINGYTADQTKIAVQTVDGNSNDVVKTVVYKANNQTIVVNYIDDNTGKTLETKKLVGKSNTLSGYTTKDSINSYKTKGYDLVSDSTNGATLKYDTDDNHDQTFSVHLKHHISQVTDPKLLTATFDRTVTEKLPKGDKQLKQHYVITRTGTQDQVTKAYTFGNWSVANVKEDRGEVADGYTAKVTSSTPSGIAIIVNGVPVIKAEQFTNENNNSVTQKNVVENVEVSYIANNQKAKINYIDDTTKKTLESQDLVGKSNTKSTYTTGAKLEEYLAKGYDLVSDDTKGSPITFDEQDKVDQVFNVHLKHHINAVTDARLLIATFDRTVTEKLPKGDKQLKQHYAITRTGTQDQVTKAYTFSNWSVANVKEDKGEVADGYTAKITTSNPSGIATIVNGVPVIKGEQFTNENNNSVTPKNVVENVEVSYIANDQKAKINYIDDTTKKTLESQDLVGKSNTKSTYNTGAKLEEYLAKGYDLVSDDTKGNPITFDEQDKVDQVFNVHLKHHINAVTDTRLLTANFDRTVTEKLPEGKNKQLKQHYVITRTGTQDQVTKAYTFGNWSVAKVKEDKIDNLEGYTAKVNSSNPKDFIISNKDGLAAKAEDFTNDNGKVLPTNLTEVAEIVYTANPQTAKISFIDDTTGQTLKTINADGHYKEKINFNPTVDTQVTDYTNAGYILVSNSFKDNTYQADNGKNNFEVHLIHGANPVSDSRTVTQTVHYNYADGTKASEDHVSSKTFTQTGSQDAVTGEISWNGDWTPVNETFEQVESPKLEGYKASKEVVDAQPVTFDSPNMETTVTYTKEIEPEKESKDTSNTNKKTNSKKEKSENKSGNKVESSKETITLTKVATPSVHTHAVKKVNFKKLTTENKDTGVQKVASPSTVKAASVATLPQTGAKDESVATYVGLALAGAATTLGTVNLKKRKKEEK